jgi:hypothetical protein
MNHHSSTDSTNSTVVSADSISRRAYELWEQEGRPENSDMRHWLQAERELNVSQSDSSARPASATGMTSTGSDVRPLQDTRAAAAASRESKRGSNAPFGEKNGQSAARRKSPQSPVL